MDPHFLLRRTATLRALTPGQCLHALIVMNGQEQDRFLSCLLIQMYGKCGAIQDAHGIFLRMHDWTVYAWNYLIGAYVACGLSCMAMQSFHQMHMEGVFPDRVTFVSTISACSTRESLIDGKHLHALMINHIFSTDVVLNTALVNMYSKCGQLPDAVATFDSMRVRNTVSWGAMLSALLQQGKAKEALQLFRKMRLDDVQLDKFTCSMILSACASVASLSEGRRMHVWIDKSLQETDEVVGNALVSMYGRCGHVEAAQMTFNNMLVRDVVTWSSIIMSYGQQGRGKEALHYFEQMQMEGVLPDRVIFFNVLSACSHAGLLAEGWRCFLRMNQDHALIPDVEHYNCMVDLFCRVGQLDEAENLVASMPNVPLAASSWMSLLGACRMHVDVERAERTAKHVFKLDPDSTAPYVVMSNIYAAAHMWDAALEMRKSIKVKGLKKQRGCSSIEVGDVVHEFFSGDTSHPLKEAIYSELSWLTHEMEKVGYVPDTSVVLHDVDDAAKMAILRHHSEKLAMAFGLISTPPGSTIRIVKNLRACPDCHAAAKYISKLTSREIIIRDANRFHHFKDGICSC
eukprot:c15415_g1_i1 orf=3-1715(-)